MLNTNLPLRDCTLPAQIARDARLPWQFVDETTDRINGKIQRAEQMKVHTMFVIGKRDLEKEEVSVRVHGKGNLGAKLRTQAVAETLDSIKARTP